MGCRPGVPDLEARVGPADGFPAVAPITRGLHLALIGPSRVKSRCIFCTGKGTPFDGVNLVRRVFKPALRRAQLPEIRFHDLRHSFASLLIAQGEHPKLISEQLGHASVKITMDRYGHLMDQSYGDASDRLDATLFGSVTPPKAATA